MFGKILTMLFRSHPMEEWSEGGAGWYSPGAPSVLTQIDPYSSSLYTVFHSVSYNSVVVATQTAGLKLASLTMIA